MFAREHELVAALAAHHRRLWPAARSRRVKAERGYGRGVADLVVLDFDDAKFAKRADAGLGPLLSVGQAYVVAGLRASGRVSLKDVGRLDRSVGVRQNRRVIAELIAAGYVLERASSISLHPSMVAPVARLVAIEAKLTDWRGGLLQASRYRSFADVAYLAMPAAAAAKLVEAWSDAARELGVGVIAVGSSNARILLRAEPCRPSERGVRVWAEESEFADAIGDPRRLIAPFPARFVAPTPEQLVIAAR